MQEQALIVIDVQNDFCPGGALEVAEGDAILPVVNQLISRHAHIILTQDWHPSGHKSFASSHPDKAPYEQVSMSYGTQTLWPDHCIQGTRGADFHPGLNIEKAEMVLRKGYNPAIDSYSAFFENDRKTPTGLIGYLKERNFQKLTFCGLATDFCVFYSAMDALKAGFSASVVLGACRAIDLDGSLDTALQTMRTSGVDLLLTS